MKSEKISLSISTRLIKLLQNRIKKKREDKVANIRMNEKEIIIDIKRTKEII